jgi:tetratricopeptide (TPR) repeat protein
MQVGSRVGPYEVTAALGAGGMGQVWRAHDSRLGRDVAVKVLPAEFASDPERLQRFEREARATAALSHPNILAVFDIGSHDGEPYIVEELVEGDSLREALNRGRMPVDRVADLASQIARGLAAAHDKSIVHRDLKPENVIVTTDGQAKILDFGLAKFVAAAPQASAATLTHVPTGATELGVVLGTAAYMAPEQALGRAVDQRADVFAFGVVLYEMLSGQRPFRGATGTEIVAAILKDEPTPLPESVPAYLRQIVDRCLQKAPEERFTSAREVLETLRTQSVVAVVAPAPPRRRRLPRRVALVAAAAVGIAVLGVAVLVIVRGRGATTAPAAEVEPRRILVVPFENMTGDPSLDAVGRMASDAIGQGLLQIGDVELATAERAAPAGAASSVAEAGRAMARERGAGTMVTGSCYLAGDTLELRTWLTDTGSGKVVYALDPDSGSRADPRPAVEAARERVKGAVAAYLSPIRGILSRPLRYEAFREFEAGMVSWGFDYEAASKHFERVVELEPECWMGYLRLATMLSTLGRTAEATKLMAKVRKNEAKLAPAELLFLKLDDSRIARNPVEGLGIARQLRELAPHDFFMRWNAAYLASLVNRPREALDHLGDVSAMDWTRLSRLPQGEWILRVAAWSHHFLGEFEAELDVAELSLRLYPGSNSSRQHMVRAHAALGRIGEVDQVIEESMMAAPGGRISAGMVMLDAAEELRAHGYSQDAVRIASRAAAWYAGRLAAEAEGMTAVANRAEALWVAERWAEARTFAEEFAKQEAASKKEPGPAAQGMLGVNAAHAGDRATASACEAALAPKSRPPSGQEIHWRACIAAQLGEKDRAVELLREGFARGLTVNPFIHRFMYLEPLHGYPPFEELIKPKG